MLRRSAGRRRVWSGESDPYLTLLTRAGRLHELSRTNPGQVDDNLGWLDRFENGRRIRTWRADDHELGMLEQLVGVLAQQRRDVGHLGFDVALVGADEAGHRDVAVEDPYVQAAPDQGFDQRDHGTLAQVVGVRLERQPCNADSLAAEREHSLDGREDSLFVGRQDR